jgi:hypothetical protein
MRRPLDVGRGLVDLRSIFVRSKAIASVSDDEGR